MNYFSHVIGIFLLGAGILCLDNGRGRTPQMGWNSWNHFGCNINETIVKRAAEALIATGLDKKGYIYVNVDDCWQYTRDKNGRIVPDKKTFPSGMKALGDYIHSLGLLFGIYSDAGYQTCMGRPGSLNFEEIDAQTYADWGVDYLKYDNCFTDGSPPEGRYIKMRDALNSTGRPIFYSMCEWGIDHPETWAEKVANSWRTTPDIVDSWKSFTEILDSQYGLEAYSGPGGWNDMDMLEIGNGGMTQNEYQAHFALWALLKSPLLLGFNFDKINQTDLQIVSNEAIIAINNDTLGKQGKRLVREPRKTGFIEIYGGELSDGYAMILFNRSNYTESIDVDLIKLDLKHCTYNVVNLITGEEYQADFMRICHQVEFHSVVVLKLIPLSCTLQTVLYHYSFASKLAFLRDAQYLP